MVEAKNLVLMAPTFIKMVKQLGDDDIIALTAGFVGGPVGQELAKELISTRDLATPLALAKLAQSDVVKSLKNRLDAPHQDEEATFTRCPGCGLAYEVAFQNPQSSS